HCAHEFIHGNSAQHLDVLENVFGHLWLLAHGSLVGLAVRPSGPEEAQDHCPHGTTDRSSGLELHFASLSRRAQKARSRPAIKADRITRGLLQIFNPPRTLIIVGYSG